MFKDDFVGAAKDLTDGLGFYRLYANQRQNRVGSSDLTLARDTAARNGSPRDLRVEAKIIEKDQPSSMETQLLFHRAGVYLTIACQHIDAALSGLGGLHKIDDSKLEQRENSQSHIGGEAQHRRLEARKVVKTNAKRALRDYIAFLSKFEYTPGLPVEITEEFLRKVNAAASGSTKAHNSQNSRLLEKAKQRHLENTFSEPAVHRDASQDQNGGPFINAVSCPSLPPAELYTVSSLFSAIPSTGLAPYPANTKALVPSNTHRTEALLSATDAGHALLAKHDYHEAITYHPLLTDALHSLLVCHSLMQTSPKELQRHAHMVARLVRVCDGYPIFLASRSPARADWIEVVRRANNWVGLQSTWEALCAPAPLPGRSTSGANAKQETGEKGVERQKHEVIMEALADDRVQDEESFREAVRARQRRAEEQRKDEASGPGPKRWAQEDGKEYPVTTERAEAVARWVREAPLAVAVDGAGGKVKKSGKKVKKSQYTSVDPAANEVSVG